MRKKLIFEIGKMVEEPKMIYKCLNACEKLFDITNVKEMQIKTMTYLYTLTRMDKIKNETYFTKSVWQKYEIGESLI